MRRVSGRSFKITKNQAKGYGYAKARRMHSNPGVTTIAAINGRGAYGANRSARSVMSKLKQNARKGVARRHLTAAQKRAFKERMAMARNSGARSKSGRKLRTGDFKRLNKAHAKKISRLRNLNANRSTSAAQSQSSRSNIKKAQRARKAWGRKLPRGKRVRVGAASYGRKPRARKLKPGVYTANRRKKAGSKPMARRRKKASGLKKKRRSSKRRRKTTTKRAAAPRRRRRKAKAGSKRRKRTGAKRRRRSSKKLTANRRRRHRRNRSKAAAPRRKRRRAKAGSKRRSSRRRKSTTGRKRRRTSRKRRGSARRKRSSLKKNSHRRRRSHRRNKAHRANPRRRRRAHRKNSSSRRGHKANRRRHRRNGRRRFRMNGVMDAVKMGAVLFGGFALHRVINNLVSKKIVPMLMPAAPAATSGLDSAGLAGLAINLGTAALTGFAVSKLIKNPETRKMVIGGVVVSAVQTIVKSLLQAFAPASFSDALSGPEDGTAARLSAMYGMRGLGAGASIMPHYASIGEYFATPMNGFGEYFREPVNGLGEYIAATSGLGSPYEANSDLMQAAAGFGAQDYQGNHIDPSGDLDRQLTIAEAAAGVGALSPFEAAAGIGPMQAAAGMRGFGAIDTVSSGDTWIPGTTNPQLWAGVRSVSEPQSATEMVPAGTLQSPGGSGIFG